MPWPSVPSKSANFKRNPPVDLPNRRTFIRTAALTGAGISLGLPACSQSRILGANDRVNLAVFGTNGRGGYLAGAFAGAAGAEVRGIGDVDTRAITKGQRAVTEAGGDAPIGHQDFRRFLDDGDIDAVVIATPDHWHAPMAIMALDAGKHVYVEKPCSHNPAEGAALVAKQKATGLKVQMGNQTRSSVTGNKVIKEIHEGLIGRAYAGKAWYSNTRGPIGTGKEVAVPDWLDWELWQGPAPRQAYNDILVHYNWHWFWRYGTGELLNNGTHEIDLCRWALQVDYPNKVTSTGGRYHYDDSWEAYDTQLVGYEFPEEKTINWEGRSCNGHRFYDRGRGSLIYGTEGSVLIDREGYTVYNLKGEAIRQEDEVGDSVSMGTTGGGALDNQHIANFLNGISRDEALNSEIEDANVSVNICHLGNMAQRTTGELAVNPTTGKPEGAAAMALWGREYAEGYGV